MFEIIESSPVAMAMHKEKPSARGQSFEKYPFNSLNLGDSFTVPFEFEKWKALRANVHNRNARSNGKEFAFIRHEELKLFEIARIK